MKSKKTNLFKNQRGQGIMEYIILTGLIGIFCLVAVKSLGRTINSEVKKINTKIDNIVEAE